MARSPRNTPEHLTRRQALAALAAAGFGGLAPPARPRAAHRLLRFGPERLRLAYADPQGAVKEHLVARINRDRQLHDVAAVRHDPRLSLVGDSFTHDQALAGSIGHWDVAGRPPYLRWGLAGGLDFHSQNAGSYSNSAGVVEDSTESLALQIHESMMDEEPPEDGHRQTILNPLLTHVGIGLARIGGEFRLTQEFSRVAMEWLEVPERPVAPGALAEFGGKPLAGLEVGMIEIAYQPPPRKATPRELAGRGSYGYPAGHLKLRPRLPAGWFYGKRERGDFEVSESGAFHATFRCDRGPGYYFVLCYVRKRVDRNPEMYPATAAMITAANGA